MLRTYSQNFLYNWSLGFPSIGVQKVPLGILICSHSENYGLEQWFSKCRPGWEWALYLLEIQFLVLNSRYNKLISVVALQSGVLICPLGGSYVYSNLRTTHSLPFAQLYLSYHIPASKDQYEGKGLIWQFKYSNYIKDWRCYTIIEEPECSSFSTYIGGIWLTDFSIFVFI